VAVDNDGHDGSFMFRSRPDNLSRMLTHELFHAIAEEVNRPRATTGH